MAGTRTALAVITLLMLTSIGSEARLTTSIFQSDKVEDVAPKNTKALPVVLWHGMGDSCCASYSIGAIKSLIEQKLGVFVLSVATGESALADIWSSYFGNVNDQVAKICNILRSTPELAGGYNAVGFSQGGQFIRAVVQRCQHLGPKAHTLITMGAQHQGVANIPGCSTVPGNLSSSLTAGGVTGDTPVSASACETMQTILGKGAYLGWVRDHVVQAQYFKDPSHPDQYHKYNPFLPDINNEKEEKNLQYAKNLASLDELVLYRFAEDTTVVPRDSSWFSTLNEDREIVPLDQQQLWNEDLLGLRQLHQSGRLSFKEAPGAHMQFSLDWFESEIMWTYLAGDGQWQEVRKINSMTADA